MLPAAEQGVLDLIQGLCEDPGAIRSRQQKIESLPVWKALFDCGGFASPDNIADRGHVVGERNFWLAPARAADKNGVTYWTNTGPPMTEAGWQKDAGLPAWWGVRFWET